jgi:hypothetical protein
MASWNCINAQQTSKPMTGTKYTACTNRSRGVSAAFAGGAGKARRQYEFGDKAGIIVTGRKGQKTITAVKAFIENPYGAGTR